MVQWLYLHIVLFEQRVHYAEMEIYLFKKCVQCTHKISHCCLNASNINYNHLNFATKTAAFHIADTYLSSKDALLISPGNKKCFLRSYSS